MNSVNSPKLQLEFLHILGPSVAFDMHQGMDANLNIKQATGNGKPQKEHPNCNWINCM